MKAAAKKGSRHRARQMVALRPAVYDLLVAEAKENRRAASWELQNILIEHFVATGRITQEKADELWDDLINRREG